MNKKSVKALSVVSPAGQLIASGRKTIEVRKWLPDITPDEEVVHSR
ncbi:ASCH domain-containing protein [Dickeya sp. NCPPB 3274]|nr:ASCH domain-containing protein [Dickeya sp. NCPPB 3274]